MQEWINAILTAEWLLGFAMALAFKNLSKAVSSRIRAGLSPDKDERNN